MRYVRAIAIGSFLGFMCCMPFLSDASPEWVWEFGWIAMLSGLAGIFSLGIELQDRA